MKYQDLTNLLDNTPNQPTKFKATIEVEINDESRGTHNKNNQIRFQTLMLRSRLCDYRDAYILVKRTVAVADETAAAPHNVNKKVILNIVGHLLTE